MIKQHDRSKGELNTYIFGKREKDQQLFYDDANLAKLRLRRGDYALAPKLAHAQLSISEKITSGRPRRGSALWNLKVPILCIHRR